MENNIEVNEQVKSKKRMGKGMYNAIRFLCLTAAGVAFAYASYSLTYSYLDYKAAEEKYSEIDDMFLQTQATASQDTDNGETQDDEGTQEMGYSQSLTTWIWDYETMLSYNNEAKGYIKLDGTRIQYPIVQHSDNDYYLTRGADKIYNGGGALFLDSRCGNGLDDTMTILYGHNMLDGSMFKDLMKFSKSDFCKENQTFDVYVGYRHYIYYVFASFRTKADNYDIYKFGFTSEEEFSEWISRCYSKSNYRYDCEKPGLDDKIIMCSTCVDDDGNRQVVCMYRGEEVVD